MNLEIRIQGKKKKYYLGHSFREQGKVRKIRRYLGVDLSKKQVEKLSKRAEILIKEQIEEYNKIIDPLKHELTERELKFIKQLEVKSNIQVEHLSEKDWEIFTELFTYNTNAIEGSTINEKEVEEILEKNKWPQQVRKEEISETYGVAEAVRYIRSCKEHISIKFIEKLHQLVFKNSKAFAGKLRRKGVEVVIKDINGSIIHQGAPSLKIRSLLNELIYWYRRHRKRYSPLILATVLHNQFENIHPFQDGNGRVGRLLLNNILIKHNLPPINIGLNNRREYYNTLQEYQKKGNIRPTIELMIKEYKALKKRLGVYKKR